MTLRRFSGLVVVAVVVLLLVIYWHYLFGAVLLFLGGRGLATHYGWRRRRPKSSWSSLGRTAAMMFAAWNSRWLKPVDVKASVRKTADTNVRPNDWLSS